MIKRIGFMILCLLPQSLLAMSFEPALEVSQMSVETAGETFNPVLVGARFSLWSKKGLGVEVEYFGSGDDERSGMTVDVNSLSAAYLMYKGMLDSQVGLALGFGEAKTVLSSSNEITSVDEETYKSGAYKIRLEQALKKIPVTVSLSYERLFKDENLRLSQYTFGISHVF